MKILTEAECQKLWITHLVCYLKYHPEIIKEFKRPFGNSDWEDDIIAVTKKVFCSNDEDQLSDMKWDYGNQAMEELIEWAKKNADKVRF